MSRRLKQGGIFATLIAVLLALMPATNASATADGSVFFTPDLAQYPDGDASYPRLIRVINDHTDDDTLLATFAKRFQGSPTVLPIYRSTDGGDSWTLASTLGSNTPGWDLEAPTLFEVPYTAGGLTAGDILAAGTAWSLGDFTAQKVEVFRSQDRGSTWTHWSDCVATSGQPNAMGQGIWEPWFFQTPSGTLGCFISDERPSGGSTNNQIIGHFLSTDGGRSWSSSITPDVAFPADNLARPGMQTIAALPDGTFMMSYEMCRDATDADHACQVYVKVSSNGLDWGDPSDPGTLVQTSDGRQLLHTPYITWSPAGGPNGTVLISGQRIGTGTTGNYTVQPESGRVIFANTNLGVGPWFEVTAPVSVDPTGGYNPGEPSCPGYSSPILPSVDGQQLLYLAGTWIPGTGNQCEIRMGSASLGSLDLTPSFQESAKVGLAEYGGVWSQGGGVLAQTANEAGTKALFGTTSWSDYVIESDVRLDADGQAGLLMRVTAPGQGADAHTGYYVGVESGTDEFVFGYQNHNWTSLGSASVVGGVTPGAWYRMRVEANGCDFALSVAPADGSAAATELAVTVPGCQPAGMAGFRSHFTAASWRDVNVTSTDFDAYGGQWQASAGVVTQTAADVAGPKAMIGSSDGSDYTVDTDLRLDSAGQAGVLVRTTNPAVGADAHTGYYVGVDQTSGQLVLGSQDNNWTGIASASIAAGVTVGDWYHLSVAVRGCSFSVSLNPVDSAQQVTVLSQTVASCQSHGAVGLRSHFTQASWRDTTVSAA
ncbi:MAG: DUF1080 domain-containing protein [Propionibacteriaceae bacterium]|nr:DUF1080 domain-containing protein [Propionibacteriaceae bacterium]